VLTHCVRVRVRRVKGKGHYRDVMVDWEETRGQRERKGVE